MLNFVANVDQAVIGKLSVSQCFPIVKIHVPAPFVDIIGNHPRYGADVAVPRPAGLIGVAISTRTNQGRIGVFLDRNMSPQ
jgi:hypothetical protein